jgi:hypothetical protein
MENKMKNIKSKLSVRQWFWLLKTLEVSGLALVTVGIYWLGYFSNWVYWRLFKYNPETWSDGSPMYKSFSEWVNGIQAYPSWIVGFCVLVCLTLSIFLIYIWIDSNKKWATKIHAKYNKKLNKRKTK